MHTVHQALSSFKCRPITYHPGTRVCLALTDTSPLGRDNLLNSGKPPFMRAVLLTRPQAHLRWVTVPCTIATLQDDINAFSKAVNALWKHLLKLLQPSLDTHIILPM